MKKIIGSIIFLFAFVALLSSFNGEHEFYISTTSIDYNKKSKSLEITQQFTTHDIEKAILKSSKIDLNIAEKNENPKSDSIIFAYIQSGFEIDGIQLNWVGKEFNLDETLWIYLESDSTEKPKKLEITNTLLTEEFESQSNITHVNFMGNQQTHSFNKLSKTFTYSIK